MTPKLELRGLSKTFGEGARQVEALARHRSDPGRQ